MTISKNDLRKKRNLRYKARVKGTASKPRVSVYKSAKHLQIQVVNDEKSQTIVSVTENELKDKEKKMPALAKSELLVKLLAVKMKKSGIKKVVFDRSGYPYLGIIEKIAESLRKEGIKL
jgi:large subunit ribosomal protein L18